MNGIFIIFVFLIIAGAAGIYGAIAARKRREELFELALRLNLDFRLGPDYGLAEELQFLKKLAQGDNRYACNILSGIYQNDDIRAFDYHYQATTHDGKGSHTTHHTFSFFVLRLPGFFPDLTVRRENFFMKVAEAFGYQVINFESAEFSKAFNVRSADRKFAYDVCNGKMMEYLLANRDLSIEIENQALALAFDSCLSAQRIEFNLQRLAQIRSLMPDYLFAQNS